MPVFVYISILSMYYLYFIIYVIAVVFFFRFLFETGFHYVAQVDLEFWILLPLPPECWDYRYELQHLAYSLKSNSKAKFSCFWELA
jgi:hypothetical protein